MTYEAKSVHIHSLDDAAKNELAVRSAAHRHSDNPLIGKALNDYEAIRNDYMILKEKYDRALSRLTSTLKLVDDTGLIFKPTKLDILRKKTAEMEQRRVARKLKDIK